MTTSPRLRSLGLAFAASAAIAIIGVGCSLTNFENKECTVNDDCAGIAGSPICGSDGFCQAGGDGATCDNSQECYFANGFGSICDANTNSCRDIQQEEFLDRCERTEPLDLLTNFADYRDRIVFLTAHDSTASGGHLGRENAVLAGIQTINSAAAFVDGDGVERKFGLIMCDELADDTTNAADYADDLGRSDAAVAVARWGVEVLGLSGIIGPAGSSDTLRAFTEVIAPAEGRVVQVANGAASPALTTADTGFDAMPTDETPGWLWRTSSSGEGQGVVLARDAFNRMALNGTALSTPPGNGRRVAIITEAGAFGSGIGDAFADEFNQLVGGNGVVIRRSYTDGIEDELRDAVNDVGAELANVDAVLFAGQVRDHNQFMIQISNGGTVWQNFQQLPIYFPQTAIGPGVFDGATQGTNLFDQVIAANPQVAIGSNAYSAFEQAFAQVEARDPKGISQTAQSWDAAWFLAAGAVWGLINESGFSGVDISRGIRRLTPDGGGAMSFFFSNPNWGSILAEFGRGMRIDASGATGDLSYDLDTEEKPTRLDILKSEDVNGVNAFVAIADCDEQPQCTYGEAP